MEVAVLILLSTGLFMGWSLGANDAANVFGTAVGTRMVRFTTAAIICSIFVILGSVISGAGAAQTLGKLGAINAIAGSSVAAFAAALTVYAMTRMGLPVSTSQAIVGAIIGWNLFSGFPTDSAALVKIVSTWVACPLLAGILAAGLFKVTSKMAYRVNLHLLRQDAYIRAGLIFAGAFGAYSLGANNIANVMGVFVSANPFTTFEVGDLFLFSGVQQLFLLGAIAIGVGVFTYSKRVMLTVGNSLLQMSPLAAWVVVICHSITLFLFASEQLEHILANAGLPTIPLVPVSSSQAVVGGVIGIGLVKGGTGIRWGVLGNIASGWVTTPVIACAVCFVSLFFMQNIFNQQVFRAESYRLSEPALDRLAAEGVATEMLRPLAETTFDNIRSFRAAIAETNAFGEREEGRIIESARIDEITVDGAVVPPPKMSGLSLPQIRVLRELDGYQYRNAWQIADALARRSGEWAPLPETTVNKTYNKKLRQQIDYVVRLFKLAGRGGQ